VHETASSSVLDCKGFLVPILEEEKVTKMHRLITAKLSNHLHLLPIQRDDALES
jgi:hypothetical protein